MKLIYGYLPTVFELPFLAGASVLLSVNVNTTGHLYFDAVGLLLQLGYSKIIHFDTLPTGENLYNLGYYGCRCENANL